MAALWICIAVMAVSNVFLWLALHQVWVEFCHFQDPVSIPPIREWGKVEEDDYGI